jgi:phage terminase large subunit GpA-like protein
MNPIRAFLIGIFKRVYRPIESMALEFWGEQNIVVSSKESLDNPGPYKRHHAVYCPRILDLFMNDPQWRTLVVMKSSQSGFTFHVLILICRKIAAMACSIIYVIDSVPKAKDLSKVRLQPMLKSCKATKLDVEASEDDINTLVYDLPNAILRLAGSGSAGQVASYPADLVVGDEMDKWKMAKGEAHKWLLLIDRIKRSEFGKAIGFSTPTVETGVTNEGFEAGSKHRIFCPCPHCDFKQLLDLDHMRFSHCKEADGKTYNYKRVLRETYMECESCRGRIDEDHKLDMMLNCELRATNYKEIEAEDGKKHLVENWNPGEMSFHVSDFYSMHPRSTWGVLVMEFLKAQGKPKKLHAWTNGRAGLPVKQTVANINLKHILRLRGNYKRGTVPVMPCVATLQVDSQGDHQKWLSMAWLPNGSRYVVDWGKTLDREEIKDVALRPIKTPEREIFVQNCIMDEGGKEGNTYEVRKFCYPLFPFFTPCKGRGGIQVKNTIYFSEAKLKKGGDETIQVIHFDDDSFKKELYIDLIKNFDAEKCKEFDSPRIYFPSDIDEELIREFCGEELVKVLDENGVEARVWKPKPPNDWGDCAKMGGVLWNVIEHKFQPKL